MKRSTHHILTTHTGSLPRPSDLVDMVLRKEAKQPVDEEALAMRVRSAVAEVVLKQAEVERRRIETLAGAEKSRRMLEAEGRAAATLVEGQADADIIFKKGEAEAKAMNVKAEAYQEWNQAAVVDKLLTGLPEVVRALAAPLANVDKITVVSTGNGSTAGLNKITGDLTAMAAQVPALFEALSGMKMSDLLGNVRPIGEKKQ